jgi:chemotaxis response regulator CheB
MRIGIANGLPMAVEALQRAVARNTSHQVVWVARNGLEAVQACVAKRPDMILMDLVMPVMDGVEATRQIMAATPCAILIVTASVGANALRTFDAMGHGALDAVDTPDFTHSGSQSASAALLAKIETISRLIRERKSPLINVAAARWRVAPKTRNLLAIGASAGGPAALVKILAALPPTFPGAIVIVQHVDQQFAPGMAEWLNQYSRIPVRIAREGDPLQRSAALLAGTNDHLCLKTATQIGYTAEPVNYVYRPSVDALFQSVDRLWVGEAVGVLLTGMGRDGALGLKALRNKGYYTIAQNQATCAVYGMPKAAAAIDAATEILALDLIAPRLVELFARNWQND